MKRKSEDAEVHVRYLLGELPEAERARIEQRFFTDEDYYEQVLADGRVSSSVSSAPVEARTAWAFRRRCCPA